MQNSITKGNPPRHINNLLSNIWCLEQNSTDAFIIIYLNIVYLFESPAKYKNSSE